MADSRTVEDFVQLVDHLTGIKLKLGWWYGGLIITDEETGVAYSLGLKRKTAILTSWEQASICRGLHREHLLLTLGLDPEEP